MRGCQFTIPYVAFFSPAYDYVKRWARSYQARIFVPGPVHTVGVLAGDGVKDEQDQQAPRSNVL